jgi:hypothetical protein
MIQSLLRIQKNVMKTSYTAIKSLHQPEPLNLSNEADKILADVVVEIRNISSNAEHTRAMVNI